MNTKGAAQIDMDFEQPVIETPTRKLRGMVRGTDAMESQRAAVDVLPELNELQARVMHIIATEGPVTDRDLEERTEFRAYAYSTVRKRRTELFQAGRIVRAGRRDKLALWDIPNRPATTTIPEAP